MLDEAQPIDRVLDWPRPARLAAVALVALLPALLALVLVVRPRWIALAEDRRALVSAGAELSAAESRSIADRELERRSPIRRRFLARFAAWVPAEEQLPEVLATAALAARQAGLRELTFARVPTTTAAPSDPNAAPAAVTPLSAATTGSQVQLEARASLPGVGAFVDSLRASPRYLRIERLRIAPLAPEREARLAGTDRGRLSLTLRLTAFSHQAGGS